MSAIYLCAYVVSAICVRSWTILHKNQPQSGLVVVSSVPSSRLLSRKQAARQTQTQRTLPNQTIISSLELSFFESVRLKDDVHCVEWEIMLELFSLQWKELSHRKGVQIVMQQRRRVIDAQKRQPVCGFAQVQNKSNRCTPNTIEMSIVGRF